MAAEGFEGSRAPADGYELAYSTLGQGEPTLVLHWGMLGDRRQFLPLAERLADRATCHVVDGRLYGASDAPRTPYSLEEYADHVADFLDAVVGGPSVLVGQSMGGMTFLRLALRRPDLVAGLVLVDTSAAAEDPERRQVYEGLLAQLEQQGITHELLDFVARASLMAPGFIEADPQSVAAWREAMHGLDVEAFVAHAHAVFESTVVSDRLGEITSPSLVVVGDEDAATTLDRSQALAEGLGGHSELVELPGAGHFAAWEQPDPTAAAVREFLSRLS
jgi:pimeloyl-ACP methyl ester carboxylesterase